MKTVNRLQDNNQPELIYCPKCKRLARHVFAWLVMKDHIDCPFCGFYEVKVK